MWLINPVELVSQLEALIKEKSQTTIVNFKIFENLADQQNNKISQLIQIFALNPFLFKTKYPFNILTTWAKNAKLLDLDQEYVEDECDELAENVVLIYTISHYTVFCLKFYLAECENYRTSFQSNNLELVKKLNLTEAIEFIKDDIFSIISKHFPFEHKEKVAAIFLISYKLFYESENLPNILNVLDVGSETECTKIKEKGILEFNEQHFFEAIESYTNGIEKFPYACNLYAYRSQAFLNIQWLPDAKLDSWRTIVLNPTWPKGYYGLSQSLVKEGNFHKAHIVSEYAIHVCKGEELTELYEEMNKCYKKCNNPNCLQKSEENQIQDISRPNSSTEKSNRKLVFIEPQDLPELTSSSDSDSETDSTLKAQGVLKHNKQGALTEYDELECHPDSSDTDSMDEYDSNNESKKGFVEDEDILLDLLDSDDESHIELQKADLSKQEADKPTDVPDLTDSSDSEDEKAECTRSDLPLASATALLDTEKQGSKNLQSHAAKNVSSVDVPELVSSSDSESECKLPELMKSKVSSFSEMLNVISSNQEGNIVSRKGKKREKKTLSKKKLEDKVNINDDTEKIKELIKQASEAASSKIPQNAIQKYQEIISKFKINSQLVGFQEIDLIRIKLCLCMLYLELNTTENFEKTKNLATEIINDHSEINSPAAYYLLGVAHYNLYSFSEALTILQTGLSLNQKVDSSDNHQSESNSAIITLNLPKTDPHILKKYFEDLIAKCKCPPCPDAICRYKACLHIPKIYYKEPNFKGLILIQCDKQCIMNFHQTCWRQMRDSLNRTDKEFLGQTCMTPDCDGIIIKVQKTNKDMIPIRTFSQDPKKPVKQRKTKFEKRQELKEIRKKKRWETQQCSRSSAPDLPGDVQEKQGDAENNSEDTSILPKQETEISSQTNYSLNKTQDNTLTTRKQQLPLYSVNSEPAYILKKKEKDSEEQEDQKPAKHKEKKKKVKNTLSLEEFCGEYSLYNEYQKRLNRLREENEVLESDADVFWDNFCKSQMSRYPQLDPNRPFFIPESVRNNAEALEVLLQSYGAYGESEAVIRMKQHIYTHMENWLRCNGPVSKENPFLCQEVASFPYDEQVLITSSGGLINFLTQSLKFAIVENFICVASDVVKAYSVVREYKKKHPKLYDALDTFYGNVPEEDDLYFQGDDEEDDDNDTSSYSSLNPHAAEYTPKAGSTAGTLSSESVLSEKSSGYHDISYSTPALDLTSNYVNDQLNYNHQESDVDSSTSAPKFNQLSAPILFENQNASIEELYKKLRPNASEVESSSSQDFSQKNIHSAHKNTTCNNILSSVQKLIVQKSPVNSDVDNMNTQSEEDYQPDSANDETNFPGKNNQLNSESDVSVKQVSSTNNDHKLTLPQNFRDSKSGEKRASEESLSSKPSSSDMLPSSNNEERHSKTKHFDENRYAHLLNIFKRLPKDCKERLQKTFSQDTSPEVHTKGEQKDAFVQMDEPEPLVVISVAVMTDDSDQLKAEDAVKKLHKELSCMKESIVTLTEKCNELETEISSLVEKNATSKAEICGLIEKNTSLEGERNEFFEKLSYAESEKICLEEKFVACQDNITKLQNKLSVEKQALSKSLEEKTQEFELKKKEWETMESNSESERRRLQQNVQRMKDELKGYQQKVDNIEFKYDMAETKVKDLEAKLETERNEGREKDNVLGVYLRECQLNKENMKKTEMAYLRFMLTETDTHKNRAVSNAENSIKILEADRNKFKNFPSVMEFYNKSICEWERYKKVVSSSYEVFETAVNRQLKEVTSGAPLSSIVNGLIIPTEVPAPVISFAGLLNSLIKSQSNAQSESSKIQVQPPTSYESAMKAFSQVNKMPASASGFSAPTANIFDSCYSFPPPPIPPPPGLSFPPTASLLNQPLSAQALSTQSNLKSAATVAKSSAKSESVLSKTSQQTSPKATAKIEKTLSAVSQLDDFSEPVNVTESSGSKYLSLSTATLSISDLQIRHKAMSSEQPSSKKMMVERLLNKLAESFPQFSEQELRNYVSKFKEQHKTLSGMKVNAIAKGVSELIEKDLKSNITASSNVSVRPRTRNFGTLKPLREPEAPHKPKRTDEKAKGWDTVTKPSVWKPTETASSHSCSICLESMIKAFKVDCGHSFHHKCIEAWISKQSTCPICRVHILLPDDFPALG